MTDVRTALYRHFNADGELLYIGISLRAADRLRQHIDGSCWRYEIARVEVEWFDSRRDASDAERSAIVKERPIFNTAHSPRVRPRTDVPQEDRVNTALPIQAPNGVVVEIDSPAQALAVSIAAGGHKLAYVAACIGRSEAYVCQLRNGKRPIPHKLVAPLCAATGSLLLAQFIDLQRAMEGQGEVERLAAMLREAA